MTIKSFNGIAAASIKSFNGIAAANLKTWNGEPWPAAGFPFADVKSLLHFNGADASTTFTDVTGKTWTVNGNAQLDTAESKWGGASGLFDGTGDYISTPDSADWSLGTNSFTIECWMRANSVAGGARSLAGQCNSAGTIATSSFRLYQSGASLNALCAEGAALKGNLTSTGLTLVTGQWYHVAYVRNGNRFDLYVDGISRSNVTETATVNNATSFFSIGRGGDYNAEYFNGWIDDFRFVNGTAAYTANFTPPAAPFPDS